MRLLLICAVLFVGAGLAFAGEHDVAWGRLAGEHMGRAEAAAKCAGYEINTSRRDRVLALYGDGPAARALHRERAIVRADREAAIVRNGREVCATLLDLYGPRGLGIAGYLLPIGSKEAVDATGGLDHGIKLGVDPRGFEALHWLRFGGIATAIETVCGARYEMAPVVQAQIYMMGQLVGPRDAMMTMTAAMSAAGDAYELKTDRRGFCSRILRDYGPESERPLVRLKRAR